MQAIQIDRYGGPEVLVRRDLPIPVPGAGEVLIRLGHAGINFMDIHTRQGKYARSQTYKTALPTTLGIEGAGVVERLGAGVEDVAVGDRVAYCIVWGSGRADRPIAVRFAQARHQSRHARTANDRAGKLAADPASDPPHQWLQLFPMAPNHLAAAAPPC